MKKNTSLKKLVIALPIVVSAWVSNAQQVTLRGKVTDPHNNPVEYGTVFIKNSLDGALTDSTGHYSFTTSEQGNITVLATGVGYDTVKSILTVEAGKEYTVNLQMKRNGSTLNEVEVSPGSFDANTDRKVTMLTPMDIYTTAGAAGDVVGVIQMLPGVEKVSDQTGLFVRGGDASESAALVDGMVVQDAFFSAVPGVAQRSRFGPYQFKGISFSSGGYSSRYGQALSGILELSTNDLPEETTISANINMAGVGVAGAKRWANSSFEAGINYTNTQPFYGITKTNLDFFQPPVGIGGFARYVWMNKKGDVLKISGNYNQYKSGINVIDPNQPDTTLAFNLKNYYETGSIYYKHAFNLKNSFTLSSSYSQNGDSVKWGAEPFNKSDERTQARAEFESQITQNLYGYIGGEMQHITEKQMFDTANPEYTNPANLTNPFYIDHLAYTETLIAGYAEAEWKPAKWFGIKPGIRYEHSELLQKSDLAPRISAAIRLNKYGQISGAYGMFYQDPSEKYLLFGHSNVNFEEATHYILNYEFLGVDRTFRVEGYYKSYSDLILENTEGQPYDPNPYRPFLYPVTNGGYGYAKGIDVFWKDKKSIKNFDYWISYSYIDTKRLYMNYPVEATPDYVYNNSLSVVTKYFIDKPGINLSLTYTLLSGRPYYDPNPAVPFLSEHSPAYQDLAFSFNYLFKVKKMFSVLYIGIDNITNNHNILGYNYSDNGLYRYPVLPALYRSIFAGVFISLTPFKKEEL